MSANTILRSTKLITRPLLGCNIGTPFNGIRLMATNRPGSTGSTPSSSSSGGSYNYQTQTPRQTNNEPQNMIRNEQSTSSTVSQKIGGVAQKMSDTIHHVCLCSQHSITFIPFLPSFPGHRHSIACAYPSLL
jgi:hypothetical protein